MEWIPRLTHFLDHHIKKVDIKSTHLKQIKYFSDIGNNIIGY